MKNEPDFPNKGIPDKDRTDAFSEAVRVCCSYMSLPLYLLFWIADLIYAPELKWEFLGLRALVVPTNIIVYVWSRRVRSLNALELLGLGFAFVNGALITAMTVLKEGAKSPYYAGLNLVALGILSFFPWRKWTFAAAAAAVFGPYYICSIVMSEGSTSMWALVQNSFFVVGTLVACVVIRWFNERLRLLESSARDALRMEISSREEVIAKKTTEGLRLRELSRQFSPQVSRAIQSGAVQVSGVAKRSKICVISIDIVGSTDRMIRIDKDSMNKVIEMFMEDSINVLVKHDITIDKFTGDGVLGFSNAPLEVKDFVDRVIVAAVEVRERIQRRSDEYADLWLDTLKIRTGIAVGFADVGFYGSEKSFRTFTAIGRPVNLAVRLCSAAAPGQIVVGHDAVKLASHSEFQFGFVGTPRLKGFESDTIKVYEVTPLSSRVSPVLEERECPSGHGLLTLEKNALGQYVFRCRECEQGDAGSAHGNEGAAAA